ncbi:MAG: MBL fold metallo-hydrolase [Balneolaceae bacterium]|nr:MBL fold metallo-hydrolase [Balneolaceae bacterium]
MKIGRFTVEQLSEGQFEFFPDGTINRQPINKEKEDLSKLISKKSSELIGINPVYITDGTFHILLDTGLGWGLDSGSAYKNVSNVVTNLEIFGVKPSDITHIVISHLHYDHSAGSSFTKSAQTVPTFPNARYYIQQSEWDFALKQVENGAKHSKSYTPDDLYRLYADSYFEMIDGKEEIIPGINLISTGGHTPGHQIVKVQDGEDCAYFLGDLVPSEDYLNQHLRSNNDVDPLQTKKAKTLILKQALKEKAFMLFYHSIYTEPGRLAQNENKELILRGIKKN